MNRSSQGLLFVSLILAAAVLYYSGDLPASVGVLFIVLGAGYLADHRRS